MRNLITKRFFLPGLAAALIACQVFASLGSEKNGFLRFDGWAYTNLGHVGFYESKHVPRLQLATQSITYLWGHLAFAGENRGFAVNSSQNDLRERIYYPIITKTLWFLGPFYAAWAVNVLFWFLACLAAGDIVRHMTQSPSAPVFAVVLAAFTPGFAVLFIEPLPYVIGIGSGFFLTWLAVAFRAWSPEGSLAGLVAAHLIAGLLIITYGTSALYVPVLMVFTAVRAYVAMSADGKRGTVPGTESVLDTHLNRRFRNANGFVKVLVCLAAPGILVVVFTALPIVFYHYLIAPDAGRYALDFSYFLRAAKVLLFLDDTFTPFQVFRLANFAGLSVLPAGPVAALGVVVAATWAIKARNWALLGSFGILVLQCLAVGSVFIVHGSTQLFLMHATLFIILGGIGLAIIWDHGPLFTRGVAVALAIIVPVWVNLPLVGYETPLKIYGVGMSAFTSDPYRTDYETRFFQ